MGLLSPFDYYGVPDEVDYTNIPWRSTRFDEQALTEAVATQSRAHNALEQFRRLGQTRCLAFCVSQRHADFMADYFRDAGVRAVAVHSGEGSAPRAHSLEQLDAGDLDVIFAVDMFNEGVDLPNVDTVPMLRPTESRILWLQQFGRGLRHRPGKTLKVIDYIGNHRVFLTKARALFSLGVSDREIAEALKLLDAGSADLPPGCSVTYELEAKEILRSLLRTIPQGDRLRSYYEEFRELHGVRPLAVEVFQDGFDPKTARRDGYTSWLAFVRDMGDLTPAEEQVLNRFGEFLAQLEITPMTKSYKMLVLLAMLDEGTFPGKISIQRLTERFADLARRYAAIRSEVGDALEEPMRLRQVIESNPINAWTGGRGTGSTAYFAYAENEFSTTFSLLEELREPMQDLVRELVEWRITVYIQRTYGSDSVDRVVAKVSHAGGRPMLFLPDREKAQGVPEGWQNVTVDGEELQANFVKIAVNVVTRPGSTENILPEILQKWYGSEAGRPGRTHSVVFERSGSAYAMVPASDAVEAAGPQRWHRYNRKEAVAALGITFRGQEEREGVVRRPGAMVLFVTLDKGEMGETYQYRDQFLSPTEFQWQSQNRTAQTSTVGQEIRNHRERGINVHLFVRKQQKMAGKTSPFLYAGSLEFMRWEGERPITVWWQLGEAVPERLREELGI